MEGNIVIRISSDQDIDAINSFYNSVYQSNRDRLKFDWEYNSAPAGKAIYVVAELKGEIIGTQCVIPYYLITFDNKTILSGKSEDTLVSEKHRGKKIFEKMYALLIDECKKKKITCIWGFTYASKPFQRLNFEIPFRSQMGIFVVNPISSNKYFASLSSKNKFPDKFKIAGLSVLAWLKSYSLRLNSSLELSYTTELESLNSQTFNYIQHKNLFGLKLDSDFLNYRLTTNPYNKNYLTINYKKDNVLLISLVFNITANNVGYLLHLHKAETVTYEEFKGFLKYIVSTTKLKNCHTLRFWGFDHNRQNQEEIRLLSKCGFTFINRGISFVWLKLDQQKDLSPQNFVLSRMSSQGTD